MQSSSPDEVALVKGAKLMGFNFVNRTPNSLSINIFDELIETWEIIVIFPFDSSRKRMSMILKNSYTKAILMVSKGADTVMIPRLVKTRSKENLNKHLNKFAVQGLRTLIMGQKIISNEDLKDFMSSYENLKVSNEKYKDSKINKMFDKMEKNLDYVGISAIEDKLQNHVPETIFKLLEADIKIWVLTGDKQVL